MDEQYGYVPPKLNSDTDSLKFRLDPTNIILEIQKRLNGGYQKISITEQGTYKSEFVKIGKKLLNDEGLQRVINKISSVVNQATVLGYLADVKEVKYFMISWRKDLRSELFNNLEKYGIENSISARHILDICSDFVYLFLTRLIERNESKSLQEIHSINEIRSSDDNKGFLGFKR